MERLFRHFFPKAAITGGDCPICMENGKPSVYPDGCNDERHSVCSDCFMKISNRLCPICRVEFHGYYDQNRKHTILPPKFNVDPMAVAFLFAGFITSLANSPSWQTTLRTNISDSDRAIIDSVIDEFFSP